MSEDQMKIVCGLDGDPTTPWVIVSTPGTSGLAAVKASVDVGKPYYVFATIPFNYDLYGIEVPENFATAPVVSTDDAVNNANIILMLETPPLDKIKQP